jgi:hypothetical protein
MNTLVRSVRLSRRHFDYLMSARFLPQPLLELLQEDAQWQSNAATVALSSQTAEEMRDVLTERMAKVGFDSAYELTPEGRVLEELIDCFQ